MDKTDEKKKTEKKDEKKKKKPRGMDGLLQAQVDPFLGLGMSEEEKKVKVAEIENEASDLWNWLHNQTHEDMHILMSLHKCTRKKWNSAFDLYDDPYRKGSRQNLQGNRLLLACTLLVSRLLGQ